MRASLIAILLVTLGLQAGCRNWNQVRSEFIDPVNQFLHKEHAKAWESHKLERVLDLYTPALAADPAFRKGRIDILDRFTRVDYAISIIDSLTQLGGESRVRAKVLLKIRGETPGGKRMLMDRWLSLLCERHDKRWRIAEESLLEPEVLATSAGPSFSEEADERGIKFTHSSRGVIDKHGTKQNYAAGSGLAVGDFDDDGHEDVLLVSGGDLRLYQNQGDGNFTDVSGKSGIALGPTGEGRFGVFADFDGDGHTDLFVGVLDAPNLLFRNRGDGTFEEVGARAGLVPCFETVAAAFADFNNDGNLDLYLVNGGNLLTRTPEPMYNALNAAPNVLYMSNGDGTFTDRTAEAGVGHTGWGLALCTADYDLDGDEDIFVGNDVGPSVLYRNRGNGVFDNVTQEAGVVFRGSTMSAAWGDVDGDTYPDILAGAMDSNSRWMTRQPGFPSPAPWYINLFFRPIVIDILNEMLYGNRFYHNNGDGTFTEVAEQVGLRRNGWSWSGCFLDYDNDGDLDVYNLNGFISGKEKQDL
jgi:enediyne biosynthesis protein E4